MHSLADVAKKLEAPPPQSKRKSKSDDIVSSNKESNNTSSSSSSSLSSQLLLDKHRSVSSYYSFDESDELWQWCRGSLYSPRDGVLHYSKQGNVDGNVEVTHARVECPRQDVFVFGDGGTVLWGVSLFEEQRWLARTTAALGSVAIRYDDGNRMSRMARKREMNEGGTFEEELDFFSGVESSVNSKDELVVTDDVALRAEHQLAFSRGLMRGLEVDQVEAVAARLLERVRDLPARIKHGRWPNSQETRRFTGELLELRAAINLYSELLDATPDVYWEEPDLEELFKLMLGALEVTQRLDVVNTRIGYAEQLLQVIRDQLNENHASKLEWCIIVLISVEILLSLHHSWPLF
jgi:uncharacterized Rmd1/YagE family protein